MNSSNESNSSIPAIGVVGAGAMGQGIAQLFSTAGSPVLLFDIDQQKSVNAINEITRLINRKVDKGSMTAEEAKQVLSRITIIDDIARLNGAEIIIEAIVEDLKVKSDLFKRLESIVSPQTVLATNTSSLSVNQIASQCDIPERVVGLHFFNPVPLMKLVELIRSDRVNFQPVCTRATQ